MRQFLSLLTVLLSSLSLGAQLYNVRIGTFQNARSDDFTELRDLGFVYGQSRPGLVTDVYLGNYSSRERASEVSAQLQGRGFRNAAPFALPSGDEPQQAYIQIALRGRDRELDWRSLERAGTLFVDATDGVTRVVTGPYPTAEAASAALSQVRELGFRDAFVKTLQPAHLVRVGVFETGIKKPLIPLDLSRSRPAPSAPSQPTPTDDTAGSEDTTVTTPSAAPITAPAEDMATPPPASPADSPVATVPPPAAPPPSAAAAAAPLPAIDVKTKRHSAAELQRVLKEQGYYTGAIDGYYGPGTAAAYQRAWNELAVVDKYRTLAAAERLDDEDLPADWPELRVLLTLADDLAAELDNADTERSMRSQRTARYTASRPLDNATVTAARRWETTVWTTLDEWATEDPLHAQLLTALRISYYQSQARLEAMYQQRGMEPVAARNAATTMLQNLLAAPLDRFS